METTNTRLKTTREAIGETIPSMARRFGLLPSVWGAMERGERPVSASVERTLGAVVESVQAGENVQPMSQEEFRELKEQFRVTFGEIRSRLGIGTDRALRYAYGRTQVPESIAIVVRRWKDELL